MTPSELVEKVNALHSLPDVTLRVNELLNEVNTTNRDLEEAILHDPALTAKLLKIVNSAYFGFPSKIATISRAISLIGQKELRNMVVATTVTESFSGIPDSLVDMNTYWYHSVTSGILARLLAKEFNRIDHERFFIAGLLHSIGKLIFFTEFPEQSLKVLDLKDQGAEAMTAKEKEVFGFTHAELGAQLLKMWQLPASIWAMIEKQFDPFNTAESVDDACILHVAMQIADKIEPCVKLDIDFEEPELDYESPVFKYLHLKEDNVRPLILEASFQAFEILSFIKPEATVIF